MKTAPKEAYIEGEPCITCGSTRRRAKNYHCVACDNRRSKATYDKNPSAATNRMLKNNYGITLEERNLMIETQGGKCACCNEPFVGKHRHAPAVDHDHETGKVRSILCHYCNAGLGHFDDSISKVSMALSYLWKHK